MIPTVPIDVLSPLAALAPALAATASAALKGALVVALAALASATLLRRSPAAARHAVWTGALVAHVVFAATAPFLPALSVPAFRLPSWLTTTAVSEPAAIEAGPVGVDQGRTAQEIAWGVAGGVDGGIATVSAATSASTSSSVSVSVGTLPLSLAAQFASSQARKLTSRPSATPPSSQPDKLPSFIALWLLGATLVMLRLLLGTVRVHKLARVAQRITDPAILSLAQRIAGTLGIARPITLLRGDRVTIPLTWGVVYPVVLLPAESDGWNDERRRVVLVHEMAHVKRLDALTQLVAQLALAVFWFDPLVWLAARRMRAEREHACDDYVLRDGTRPSLYAHELLDMVRRLGATTDETVAAPAFAALAMARRSEFEGRMLAILDPVADRHALNRARSVACAAAALVVLTPIAAVRPLDARATEPTGALAMSPAAITTPLMVAVERGRGDGRAARPTQATTAVVAVAATGRVETKVPPPAPQETLPIMYRCTKADVRSNDNTYAIHTDTDRPGRHFIEHYAKRYGRCLHVVLVGRVSFTADERDIATLGPGARVQINERTLDWHRALVVTRDSSGTLRRSYTVDGRPAPFNAAAQAWVSRMVQDLARESGSDVPTRVTRIRARGGVTAVLEEIAGIESSSAKRKHYEALFAAGGLTSTEVDMIVRHAGRELGGSSGDLRGVLRHVPAAGARSLNGALEEAINRLGDGDKQQVLTSMLETSDPSTVLVVLRLAERIAGDGEKSSLLKRAAPRALDSGISTLREAFFRTYATLGGDGEKHEVLMVALRSNQKSPALARDVIRASLKIGSDGEKAAVLISVVKNRLVTTDELRDEYIKAARTIGSDGEYRQVIDALLGGKTG